MTRRIPDETAICCYCKWWRDPEITGCGDCLAHGWKSWYNDFCKCFSKGRVPRRARKIMAKVAAKTQKKTKEEVLKRIKEACGEAYVEGLPF